MSTEARERDRVWLGTRAFLWLSLGIWAALLAPPGLAFWCVLICNALLFALFLDDAARLGRARLHVTRELPSHLRMGSLGQMKLAVHNESAITLRVTLEEDPPDSVRLYPYTARLRLPPGARAEFALEVLPLARGTARFGPVTARLESRLGMAARIRRCTRPDTLRVLPDEPTDRDLDKVRRNELGSLAQRLRRAPQGGELESLRDYVEADPLRSVDWKATARRHRPVTRLYRPERSQTLWIVLDASRTMATAIGTAGRGDIEKTRFDVAVETALSLADAALRAGDQVGALVYGDGRKRLVPPARGRSQFRRLLDALTDAQPAAVPLHVRGLLAELELRARKRALVVILTDLENETHAQALCAHAHVLTRRHLTMCVSLLDAHTRARAHSPPGSDFDVYQRAAAIDLLHEREELRMRLEKRGVMVLEADVRGLARRLLDHYLQVKLSARL